MQQKRATGEVGQAYPFHTATAETPKGRIGREEFVHGQALVDPQAVQCRGPDPGVRALADTEYLLHTTPQVHALGGRPLGHLLRKRHHHQGETEHRRIERIAADPAIQVLAEHHGQRGSTDRQPPGTVGRQGQGQ
ncbi:hypothetical protein D3C73_1182510 [compost metagenome]